LGKCSPFSCETPASYRAVVVLSYRGGGVSSCHFDITPETCFFTPFGLKPQLIPRNHRYTSRDVVNHGRAAFDNEAGAPYSLWPSIPRRAEHSTARLHLKRDPHNQPVAPFLCQTRGPQATREGNQSRRGEHRLLLYQEPWHIGKDHIGCQEAAFSVRAVSL